MSAEQVERAPHPVIAALRQVRIDSDVKLATIGRRLGVSTTRLNNWELGVRMPSFEVVSAWAAVLGYEMTLRRTVFEVEPITPQRAAQNRAVLALADFGGDDDYGPGGAA